MDKRRRRLTEQRLAPFHAARHVAYSYDRPRALHRSPLAAHPEVARQGSDCLAQLGSCSSPKLSGLFLGLAVIFDLKHQSPRTSRTEQSLVPLQHERSVGPLPLASFNPIGKDTRQEQGVLCVVVQCVLAKNDIDVRPELNGRATWYVARKKSLLTTYTLDRRRLGIDRFEKFLQFGPGLHFRYQTSGRKISLYASIPGSASIERLRRRLSYRSSRYYYRDDFLLLVHITSHVCPLESGEVKVSIYRLVPSGT
jgi:hypothetical protein